MIHSPTYHHLVAFPQVLAILLETRMYLHRLRAAKRTWLL